MNPRNSVLLVFLYLHSTLLSSCNGNFVLKFLDLRCDAELEPKMCSARTCKLDTKKVNREVNLGITPAIPIEDFEMNVEIFRMRGQKARSVFNATENICKMVKLSTSLNFVYHLARAKAPEIVHPCPYINQTYITVSEEDMKFIAPTASLLADPGKYRINMNIIAGDHVLFNSRLYIALRSSKY